MLSMMPAQITGDFNKQLKPLVKSAKDISFKEIHSILQKVADITDSVLFKPSYESVFNKFIECKNILSDKLAFVKEENLAIRYEEKSALQSAKNLIIILNKRFDALSTNVTATKQATLSVTNPNNNATEYKSESRSKFNLFNKDVSIVELLKLTLKFIEFNQRISLCRINKITYKNLPLDIQSGNLSKINILTLGCYFIILENNSLWKNSTYGQLIEIYHLAESEKKKDNSLFFRNKLKSLEDKPDEIVKKKKSFCVIS